MRPTRIKGNLMKKYILGSVVAIALGIIGYFLGKVESRKQISEIRDAWYKASIEEEKFCAELYAKCYLMEEDHNNPTYASLMAQGLILGTSHALGGMNQVAIAFGEDSLLLSDVNTIMQRIENIGISMINDGKITDNQNN